MKVPLQLRKANVKARVRLSAIFAAAEVTLLCSAPLDLLSLNQERLRAENTQTSQLQTIRRERENKCRTSRDISPTEGRRSAFRVIQANASRCEEDIRGLSVQRLTILNHRCDQTQLVNIAEVIGEGPKHHAADWKCGGLKWSRRFLLCQTSACTEILIHECRNTQSLPKLDNRSYDCP